MQRLACTDPAVVARSVGVHKLNSVLAHVIQTVFTAGAPAAAGASGGAPVQAVLRARHWPGASPWPEGIPGPCRCPVVAVTCGHRLAPSPGRVGVGVESLRMANADRRF